MRSENEQVNTPQKKHQNAPSGIAREGLPPQFGNPGERVGSRQASLQEKGHAKVGVGSAVGVPPRSVSNRGQVHVCRARVGNRPFPQPRKGGKRRRARETFFQTRGPGRPRGTPAVDGTRLADTPSIDEPTGGCVSRGERKPSPTRASTAATPPARPWGPGVRRTGSAPGAPPKTKAGWVKLTRQRLNKGQRAREDLSEKSEVRPDPAPLRPPTHGTLTLVPGERSKARGPPAGRARREDRPHSPGMSVPKSRPRRARHHPIDQRSKDLERKYMLKNSTCALQACFRGRITAETRVLHPRPRRPQILKS